MERICETCDHYNTDRKDQPCFSCFGKINWEPMEEEEMENRKVYNDDVERIVNDPERQEAINAKYDKWRLELRRKIMGEAVIYSLVSVAFGLMGCMAWETPWILLTVCCISALYAAFCIGRWVENIKCMGWM